MAIKLVEIQAVSKKIPVFLFSVIFGLAWQWGIARADFNTGEEAFNNKDFNTAFHELAPLAMKGNPAAQYYLGHMYRHGNGVAADIVKSTNWFNSSAKLGYVHAQYTLGLIFRNMAVTKSFFAKAVKWLTAASQQGHVEAQFVLGKMYRDGYGVEVDNVKALVLLIYSAKRKKDARGPRDQLAKRMSKKQIATAKRQKMAVLKDPAKIKTFAESKNTETDVKGKCGTAGSELYLTSKQLGKISADLENCLGEEWGGDLCSDQIDSLNKSYKQFNEAVEIMNKHC